MPSKFFQFKKNLFLAILLLVIFVLPNNALAANLLTVGSASSSLSGTDSAIFANIDSASPTSTFLLMLKSGSTPKFSVDKSGNVSTPGTIAAGSFTGPLTGTISAANVSSGTFGANTSLGNFYFPESVGIGTTTPGQALHISGSSAQLEFTRTGATTADFRFIPGYSAISNTFSLYNNVAASYSWVVDANQNFLIPSGNLIVSGTGNSSFAGNVGIGTTNPAQRLDVKSSGLNTQPLQITASDGSSLLNVFENSTGDGQLFIKDASGNSDVVLNTAGNSYFNGGNVGIGTNNPQSKFEVYSTNASGDNLNFKNSVSAAHMFLGVTNNSNKQLAMIAYGDTQPGTILGNSRGGAAVVLGYNNPTSLLIGTFGNQPVVLGQNNAEVMRIAVGGNVGIGSTTPNFKFVVNGDASFSGYQIHNVGAPATGTDVANRNYVDSVIAPAATTTVGLQSGFWTTGAGSSIYNNNTGNVGIGTTNPQAKLHILQAIDTDGLIIHAPSTNSDGIKHYSALTFSEYADKTGNYSQIRNYSNLWSSWGSSLTFNVTAGPATPNTLIEAMRINPSGNVGISSTTPGSLLTVGSKLSLTSGGTIYGATSTRWLDLSGAIPSASLVVPHSIKTEEQLISTVTNGTAPLAVNSNTLVSNLNADLLDGSHAADFQKVKVKNILKTGLNLTSGTFWYCLGTLNAITNGTKTDLTIESMNGADSPRIIDASIFTAYSSGRINVVQNMALSHSGNMSSWGIYKILVTSDKKVWLYYVGSSQAFNLKVTVKSSNFTFAPTNEVVYTEPTTVVSTLTLADQLIVAPNLNITAKNGIFAALVSPKWYPSADSVSALQINKADGVTNIFNIDTTNSRIGIGITAPTKKLDVDGDLLVRNAATFSSSITLSSMINSGNRILMIDNSGVLYSTSSSIATGLPSPSGISGYTLRSNGTSWIANNLLYNNGTNVGIGLTNPSARLQVKGGLVADYIRSIRPEAEIAQGCAVSISGGNLVDGGPTYRTQNSYWQITAAGQSMTLNCGGWWHTGLSFAGSNRYDLTGTKMPADFTVEKSTDGVTWTNVATVTNNTENYFNVNLGDAPRVRITVNAFQSGETKAVISTLQFYEMDDFATPSPFGYTGAGHVVHLGNNLGIGTPAPQVTLDVNGLIKMRASNITTTSDVINKGYLDSALEDYGSSNNFWKLNGSNLYSSSTAWNVGIGTTNPGAKLDVVGGAIRTNNQLISTVANGTAPLIVTSGTKVTNLNADLLDDVDSARIQYLNSTVGEALDASTLTAPIRTYRTTAGGTNFPVATNNGGVLQNFIAYDSNYGYQTFAQVSAGNIYWRTKSAGTWGSWKTVYDNGNLTNTLSTNYISKWNGSKLANSLIYDNGTNVGIGTTSPQVTLDVNGLIKMRASNITTTSDVINKGYLDSALEAYGSSNNFWKLNGSNLYSSSTAWNVGIGTTTLANADGWARVLDVYGVSHAKSIVTTNSGIETGTYSHNTGFFGSPAGGIIGTRSNHPLSLITNAASRMTILTSGNVGISSTTPSGLLAIGNYFSISNLGTIYGPTTDRYLDLYGAQTNSIVVPKSILTSGGKLGVGTTAPGGKAEIAQGMSDYTNSFTEPHLKLKTTSTLDNTGFVGITYDASTSANYGWSSGALRSTNGQSSFVWKYHSSSAAGTEYMRISQNGSVGIGTSTPSSSYKLDVAGNVRASQFCLGSTCVSDWSNPFSTSTILSIGGLNLNNGNITNINKLTVGTIDPLYRIDGTNYSSFAAAIVGGVKEEYLGRVKISQAKGKEYEYRLDFAKLSAPDELWVWRQTVDFSPENVEVSLTPYGAFANIYYIIEEEAIIFRADKPITVSYRLSGKRVDWQNWPTEAIDQQEEPSFIINKGKVIK